MKVLKIKDNTQVKKDALSDIDILTGKIADKTLEQLVNRSSKNGQ